MYDDKKKTAYELSAEAAEIEDVLHRLYAARGMVDESWSGGASKHFIEKLGDVIAEIEDVKKTINKMC